MDIDVKNALDRMITICGGKGTDDEDTAKETLAKDIYAFISNISLEGSKERFNYFSKVYLGGQFKAEDFSDMKFDELPEGLKKLIDSNDNLDCVDKKDAKVPVAFFTTLGRHYMSNMYDRSSINTSRFIDVIKDMNSYIDMNIPEKNALKANENVKSEIISSNRPTDTDNVSGEHDFIQEEPEESLEELLEKLNSLIGLEGVKKEVNGIINMIKVKKKKQTMKKTTKYGKKMLLIYMIY